LNAFISGIFTPLNYAADAVLMKDMTTGQVLVTLPESLSLSAMETWIRNLPDFNPPSWIGLPATAEHQLRRQLAQQALSRLALLQGLMTIDVDDEAAVEAEVGGAGAVGGGNNNIYRKENVSQQKNVTFQQTLLDLIQRWLTVLPTKTQWIQLVTVLQQNTSYTNHVFVRNLSREMHHAAQVISILHEDLESVR
jgi:hypothetical protein